MTSEPLNADGRKQHVNGLIAVLLMLITISVTIFTTIGANISFGEKDLGYGFSLTLIMTAVTAFSVWTTWRYSPNSGKTSSLLAGVQYALAPQLVLYILIISHGPRGPHFSDEVYALQDAYFYALAAAMVGLAYARWKVRHPSLTKPQPHSWQTASYIVYSYGTPLWVFVGLAAGLAAVAGCLWYAAGYEGALRGLSPGQFDEVNAWGAILFLISAVGAYYLVRSKLRMQFPDEPYIWLTASGLNIRGRMVLDWAKVTRIEFHWELQRSGKRKTGLDIYSPEFRTGECVTIPFFNATVKPDSAMDAIKVLQQAKHISFEEA